MQIIEHSVMGTRSAVLRLRRPATPLEFLVFPMLHVAGPAFYEAVADRLRRCDLLVVEGITGRSPLTSAMTMTYRVLPANRRSGLIEDPIRYGSLGVPVITPDMSGEELGRGWRAIPWRFRLFMWSLLPVATVYNLVRGRRALLGPEVEINDLAAPTDEDLADFEFAERIDGLILRGRDVRVVAALAEIVRTRSAERIDVGVVYGAGHTAAIVTALADGYGYRPRTAEWLTIVDA